MTHPSTVGVFLTSTAVLWDLLVSCCRSLLDTEPAELESFWFLPFPRGHPGC